MPRKKISKKEFVAGLPASMPAAEVCAKGERIGILLNPKQVSNIRSDLKMKAAAEAGAVRGPKLRRALRTVTTTATSTVTKRRSSAPPVSSGLVLPPASALQPPLVPGETDSKTLLRIAITRIGIDEAKKFLSELEAQMKLLQ